MKSILDTAILIYNVKGDPVVAQRATEKHPDSLYTTIRTKAELLFGAHHSERKKKIWLH